ncbi:MAG: hypothetical protein RSA91_00410 [Bacilli bacterium]
MGTKLINFVKGHREEILRIGLLTFVLIIQSTVAYAADSGTSKIDAVVTFMTDWFKKIGFVVALVGGVQFGLAFKNDDANAKTNAIRMIASGFMVWGVGMSKDTFGL